MFSRKLRLLFGLPPSGPLPLSAEQLERLRIVQNKYSKRKGSAGHKLERAFLKAWKYPGKYSSLVASVRRATPEEDLYQLTDAVMSMKSGRTVNIQLTSRMLNRAKAEMEFRRHGRENVAFVELSADESKETIRSNTISAVTRFLMEF